MSNSNDVQTADILREWPEDKLTVLDTKGNIDRLRFRVKVYRLSDLKAGVFTTKFDEVLNDLIDEIQARINPKMYSASYYDKVLKKAKELEARGILPTNKETDDDQ